MSRVLPWSGDVREGVGIAWIICMGQVQLAWGVSICNSQVLNRRSLGCWFFMVMVVLQAVLLLLIWEGCGVENGQVGLGA